MGKMVCPGTACLADAGIEILVLPILSGGRQTSETFAISFLYEHVCLFLKNGQEIILKFYLTSGVRFEILGIWNYHLFNFI